MKHLGDITKISGAEAPVVDCIIGGSPCQDLSIAGKREGLAGERSGLFMEQIRIVKEMRQHERDIGRIGQHIRPRYMVWENVPGAFSSNKGKDFGAVLEETIRVAEPEAPNVPVPEKGWPTSGCLWDEMGKWSVAWRVLDAQFWGVPQRRRRIALVADFGGLSAGEILFVRKSVSGDTDEGKQKREKAAGDAGEGSGGAVPYTVKIRSGCEGGGKGALIQTDKSATLSTLQDQTLFQPVCAGFMGKQGAKAGNIGYAIERSPTLSAERHDASVFHPVICMATQQGGAEIRTDDKAPTLTAAAGMSGNNQPVVFGIGSYHSNAWKSENPHSGVYEADIAKTLDSLNCGYPACNQGGMAVVESKVYSIENHPADSRVDIDYSDKCQTLTGRMGTGGGNVPQVMEMCMDDQGGNQISVRQDGKTPTLRAETHGNLPCVMEPVSCLDVGFLNSLQECSSTLLARGYKDPHIINVRHVVRRLTPMECERLQGFPDGWTEIGEWVDSKGKKHKAADAPRYKALGNSIAIPPWMWVLKRLCACYEREATMASLFDGIGGFPYIWEQLNGKGSCLWASEIEEFPIAVTKLRFGGEPC